MGLLRSEEEHGDGEQINFDHDEGGFYEYLGHKLWWFLSKRPMTKQQSHLPVELCYWLFPVL